MQSVKQTPKSQRPRERLEQFGPEALSTTELFMILLGSGSQKTPVNKLAQHIDKLFKSQPKVELKDLVKIPGVGLAKACQILSSLELVQRLQPQDPDSTLDSLDKVLSHLEFLKYSEKETIVGLYLNARMKLVHRETLAIGSLNQSVLMPRDVFRAIKQHTVLYLIIAHNHPSGDAQPSLEDKQFTQTIQQAGDILGVELLDHVIVAKKTHFSFKQQGLI